jgi:hypothetical protein
MRSLLFTVVLAVGLSVLLVACSGSGPEAAPSASPAPATITLTTQPNPPVMGDVEIKFMVMDSNGQPVSGADFDVIADHTEMNGMTMHGKATDQGGGSYAINTDFSMPGMWKLTVQVRKDALDYKQEIDLQIQ